MDKNRKKELLEQYKQMQAPMGIMIVRSKSTNKCYLQATQNLKAAENGLMVRLLNGMHHFKELQKAWMENGADDFIIEMYEELPHAELSNLETEDKDYSGELEVLMAMCEERIKTENLELYKRSLRNV